MLIKLWEHLRVYDKWPEATARFETADLQKTTHTDRAGNVSHTWASLDTLVWTDRLGTSHSANFKVPDDSSIYQMIDGDTVTIRYNPSRPDRFYYRELLKTRITTCVKYSIVVLFFLALIGLRVWLGRVK
jgi:endonuclease YncB( thermonuclease family)